MKIPPARVATFVDRPDPRVRVVLLFGPDQGMVRERATRLAKTVTDDLSDAFRVAAMTGADLAADPARLPDEAAAIAMTGGRRVVQVRDATDGQSKIFESFLSDPSGDALVVVEAGDLAPRSKLRRAFEASDRAAALGCYHDESGALATVIAETLGAYGVSANRDAVQFLVGALGGDRGVTRRELEKLAIHAGQGETVTLADAMTMVGDSTQLSLDSLALAVGGGDAVRADALLRRLLREGSQPVGLLRATARHFLRLHAAASAMRAGRSAQQAMAELRPPVFFKQAEPFRAQLERWGGERGLQRLESVLRGLADAEARCKTSGIPAEAVCGRALLVAATAARGGPA